MEEANKTLESFLVRWRERRKAQSVDGHAAGGSATQVKVDPTLQARSLDFLKIPQSLNYIVRL